MALSPGETLGYHPPFQCGSRRMPWQEYLWLATLLCSPSHGSALHEALLSEAALENIRQRYEEGMRLQRAGHGRMDWTMDQGVGLVHCVVGAGNNWLMGKGNDWLVDSRSDQSMELRVYGA